jgi:hypothetical protein
MASRGQVDEGEGIVWYENLGFDIGARVAIVESSARVAAGAASGSVVGFDASGPRPGEPFVRVLVQPDGALVSIVALPPAALAPEDGSELGGLARSILTGAEQTLGPERFRALMRWLAGDAARALAADPAIRRQRVRAGGLALPGLVFPELVHLAVERAGGL